MKSFLIFSISVCLVGCAYNRTGTVSVRPSPAPPVSPDRTGSIRYPETLRAYYMGRYVDPTNPLMMHEDHALYRVETTSRWNLHPRDASDLPVARLESLSDPAHAPPPSNDAITAELNQQKELTRKVTAEARRLTETLRQLNAALTETKAQAKQNAALREKISALEARLSALERLRGDQRKSDADTTNNNSAWECHETP